MRQAGSELSIRSFREGDEAVLCQLFNSYLADFLGPIHLTPSEWRAQFRQQSWTGPSLTEDADACRIAEARGKIQGYAITDYQPNGLTGAAVLQELCTAEEANTDQVMHALLEDAEKRARERGKLVLIAQLSPEDGRASDAVEEEGFDSQLDDGEVFMAAVGSLPGLLAEMEPALSARLKRSALSTWRGEINVSCGGQSAGLKVRPAGVTTGPPVERPAMRVSVRPDGLPLLLFGREPVGELYVQDCLSVEAPNAGEALRLLDVLFPRVPIFLPRAQWW